MNQDLESVVHICPPPLPTPTSSVDDAMKRATIDLSIISSKVRTRFAAFFRVLNTFFIFCVVPCYTRSEYLRQSILTCTTNDGTCVYDKYALRCPVPRLRDLTLAKTSGLDVVGVYHKTLKELLLTEEMGNRIIKVQPRALSVYCNVLIPPLATA